MSELRTSIARTAADGVVEVACDRIKVTSRGDLLGVVGGFDTDDENRARRIFVLPNGARASVNAGDFSETPPMPLLWRARAAAPRGAGPPRRPRRAGAQRSGAGGRRPGGPPAGGDRGPAGAAPGGAAGGGRSSDQPFFATIVFTSSIASVKRWLRSDRASALDFWIRSATSRMLPTARS
jgi:hypothetical protein